jgi:plasmid stabilization system protein ParE
VRIEWLPAARRDRASQLAYIAQRSRRAALAMGDAIDAVVARLAEHPLSLVALGTVNPNTAVMLHILQNAAGVVGRRLRLELV